MSHSYCLYSSLYFFIFCLFKVNVLSEYSLEVGKPKSSIQTWYPFDKYIVVSWDGDLGSYRSYSSSIHPFVFLFIFHIL